MMTDSALFIGILYTNISDYFPIFYADKSLNNAWQPLINCPKY